MLRDSISVDLVGPMRFAKQTPHRVSTGKINFRSPSFFASNTKRTTQVYWPTPSYQPPLRFGWVWFGVYGGVGSGLRIWKWTKKCCTAAKSTTIPYRRYLFPSAILCLHRRRSYAGNGKWLDCQRLYFFCFKTIAAVLLLVLTTVHCTNSVRVVF